MSCNVHRSGMRYKILDGRSSWGFVTLTLSPCDHLVVNLLQISSILMCTHIRRGNICSTGCTLCSLCYKCTGPDGRTVLLYCFEPNPGRLSLRQYNAGQNIKRIRSTVPVLQYSPTSCVVLQWSGSTFGSEQGIEIILADLSSQSESSPLAPASTTFPQAPLHFSPVNCHFSLGKCEIKIQQTGFLVVLLEV